MILLHHSRPAPAATAPAPDAEALARLAGEISARAGSAEALTFLEHRPFGSTTTIEKYRLSNGLKILLSVDHAAPVVAYQTWFRVGSCHERPGRTGMAHLFEHLLFKGTYSHPEGEFDRVLEEAGVSNNAATWLDWTYYRESLPREAFELVTELESDRMTNLRLEQRQLDSERSVVMNERKSRVDNDPEGILFERYYARAFPNHPYGWPTIGWMEDIQAITLEDCIDFYRTHYAPNNATLVIVGDVSRERALAAVVARYGRLAAREAPVSTPPPPRHEEWHETLHLQISSPKVALGFRGVALGDPDLPALEVLMDILLNSESARLHKLLVSDDEVASGVGGWVDTFALPGMISIYVTLKPGIAPDEALTRIETEIAMIIRNGPEEKELEKARHKLEIDFVRATLTVGSRARVLGTFESTAGDYKRAFEVVGAYQRVTAEEVRHVAARYLRPEKRIVITALPTAKLGAGCAAAPKPEDNGTNFGAGARRPRLVRRAS